MPKYESLDLSSFGLVMSQPKNTKINTKRPRDESPEVEDDVSKLQKCEIDAQKARTEAQVC